MDEHRDLVRKSEQWLLERQDASAGGWGEQAGRTPSALNTAEVLLGLLEFEHEADLERTTAMKRGVAYLVAAQLKDGTRAGAWGRHVPLDDVTVAFPDVVRTSLALQAVVRADPGGHPECVAAATRWLLAARNGEGLWGYGGAPTQATSLVASAAAIEALIAACRGSTEKCEADATAALAAFAKTLSRDDGSFGADGPLHAAHTMHAILLLQKAREREISEPSGIMDAAIAWLLQRSPDEIVRMVEEQIELDPATPAANYGFLYVTDTLAIRVLAETRVKDEQRQLRDDLYTAAIASVRARSSGDGGFYGERVLSWSTARAMAALWAAKDYEPAEKKPAETGAVPSAGGNKPDVGILVLLALIAVMVGVVVAVAQGADAMQIGIVAIVLLGLTLVGYDKMSEDGVLALVKSVFGRSPKG